MSSNKPKARFICTKPNGLGTGATNWLRKHGVVVRPTLSQQKIKEITEVFGYFDEDDSGAIETHEAHNALKLLGLRATKAQVAKLVENYDVNDSGDLDIDEFIQMMTEHMLDQEEESSFNINSLSSDNGFNTKELNLVLGALRRRNLLQAVLETDYGKLEQQKRKYFDAKEEEAPRKAEMAARRKAFRKLETQSSLQRQIESRQGKEGESRKAESHLGHDEKPQMNALESMLQAFQGKSPVLKRGNYREMSQSISKLRFSTPVTTSLAKQSAKAKSQTVVHHFIGMGDYFADCKRQTLK